MQLAYKVVQIQEMSAYSVGSSGPDSCVCIGTGIGESRLYGFSGYRGGPEPFHISGLHCIGDRLLRADLYQTRGVTTTAVVRRLYGVVVTPLVF